MSAGRWTEAMDRRRMLRITAVAGVAGVCGGGLLSALLREDGLRRVRITRPALGTLVSVTLVHPDGDAAREGVESTFAEIERLESILSRHRPGTPLAALNARGRIDDAPAELLEVLEVALRTARETDGAFDPTVAPLLAVWSAATERGETPSQDEIARALARVDHRAVRVEGGSVVLEPGAMLTLDGIAKGYVVDGAAAALARTGADRVLVDAGGDMASSGPGGEPWEIDLQHPRGHSPVGTVRLSGHAVATSGDYLQAFTADLRSHHIVDPRTGRSPERTSSVSVVAPTATEADALSTAAFVLGPGRGVEFLEGRPGVAGLIVDKGGEVHRTAGFR